MIDFVMKRQRAKPYETVPLDGLTEGVITKNWTIG
jgi:hypothetical protein